MSNIQRINAINRRQRRRSNRNNGWNTKAAQSQEIWRAVLEYKLEIKTSVFLIYFVVASTFLVFSYFFYIPFGISVDLWIINSNSLGAEANGR